MLLGVCLSLCGIAFVAPSTALAVDVVTAWTLPAPNTNYDFTDDIVLTGDWVLPPDWVGNIYVYQDGVQMHDIANPMADCTLSPAPAGCYIPINNIGNTATSSANFSFNLGPQPDGAHSIQIKFWGGEFCAVKAELNAQIPPPSPLYTGTCPPDENNFNAGQIYPLRSYTVNLPLYPRITVTPSGNPALDFANVTVGSKLSKTFFVTNTGQQTLNFIVSGVTSPYYCVGGSCAQAVAMNQTKQVTIQFVPESVGTYPANVVFTCSSPLGCDHPSITRPITGSAIGVAVPPTVTVITGTPVNFGSFYLGNPTSVDRTITVKNTGGGLLNGDIVLPSGEYTCVGSCHYSLFAGDTSPAMTIRFTPTVANPSRSDTAVLSNDSGGPSASTLLNSSVSDTPVLRACVLNCPGSWAGSVWNGVWDANAANGGNKINIGAHVDVNVYVQNTGGGKLTGTLTGLPDRGFTFIPNANYPYTNITSAMGWVNIGTFRFEPSDDLAADAYALFSNDTPAGGNTNTIHLYGQGNNQPVSGGGTTVTFGAVVINTTKTTTLTVTNSGVGVLNVSIPVGALSNPAFSCVTNCTLSLGAGMSDTITFSFTPTTKTTYTTTVDVGGRTVGLSGNGIQPEIRAAASDVNTGWNWFPFAPTIQYGTTYFGSPVQDKSQNLYIESKGGAGTRVNYSIDTSASPHFKCTANCSGIVSVDNPYFYYVYPVITFQPGNAPGGAGDYTESITINYNFAPNDPTPLQYTYQVHGTSVSSPYMTVSPVSHSYAWPPTVVGNSPTTIFKVKNEGVGPLSGSVNIPASGELVGLWTFDAADMDWVNMKSFDTSGKGNTGTLSGSPTASVGRFADALHFSSAQSVNLGAASPAFDFAGDVSGAAWIKTTANNRGILSYQNGNPLIYMEVGASTAGGNANKFVVYLRTNWGSIKVFSSTKTVNDGAWHHVAFVRSAMTGKVKLFVDGVLDSTFAYADTWPISTSGGVHSIGSLGGSYAFSGDIDDVRMYNRALSMSEISQLFNGQVVVYDPVFKCIDPIPCVFNNLPAGDSMDVTFSFSPADEFAYSAQPLFTSDGGNIIASLSGTGVYQPMIKLTPDVVTDPATYVGPFSFLDVGTSNLGAYIEKNVRVWNVGRGPLTGNITFTNGVHFSCQPLATGCSLSIPENGYQDVTIRFAPLAIDEQLDNARFTSNAFNGTQTVQVRGFGIFASIINILGSGQNFPPVVIGKWKEQNITIKNTGTVDFGTGTFALTGPFKCVASTAGPLDGSGLCPYQLDAGGSTVITVRFTPTVPGAVNGLVSLSTLSLANFFVSGTGVSPNLQFIEK